MVGIAAGDHGDANSADADFGATAVSGAVRSTCATAAALVGSEVSAPGRGSGAETRARSETQTPPAAARRGRTVAQTRGGASADRGRWSGRLLVLWDQEPARAAGTIREREAVGLARDEQEVAAARCAVQRIAAPDGESATGASARAPVRGDAATCATTGGAAVTVRAVRPVVRLTRARRPHFPGPRGLVCEWPHGLQWPRERPRGDRKPLDVLLRRATRADGRVRSAARDPRPIDVRHCQGFGREPLRKLRMPAALSVRLGGLLGAAVFDGDRAAESRARNGGLSVKELPQAPRNESRHRLALLPAGA